MDRTIFSQLRADSGFSLLETVVCTAILGIALAATCGYVRGAVQRSATRDAALIRRLIIRSQIAALMQRRTVTLFVQPHRIYSEFREAARAQEPKESDALFEQILLPQNFQAQIRGSQRSLSSYGTGSSSPGTIVLTTATRAQGKTDSTVKNHCTITVALRGRVRISCQHL